MYGTSHRNSWQLIFHICRSFYSSLFVKHAWSKHTRGTESVGTKTHQSLYRTTPIPNIPVKILSDVINCELLSTWNEYVIKIIFSFVFLCVQMGVVGAAMNSQFVISNGDNFYDTGLKGTDDPRFSSSFSDVYSDPSLMTQWYAGEFGSSHQPPPIA